MNPCFTQIASYQTVISTNGDPADVYYPQQEEPIHFQPSLLPIALFLQGFNVEKSYYAEFARMMARYGFVVVVPNHRSEGSVYWATEESQIPAVLAYMQAENANPESAVAGMLDTNTYVLLGHSRGGVTGLKAIFEMDIRPEELAAAVFFGTASRLKIARTDDRVNRFPLALIAGAFDSIIPPEYTRLTYDQLPNSPKAYIEIAGANHYAITDVAQPLGGPKEFQPATLAQETGMTLIAEWSAIFLRAYLLREDAALAAFSENASQSRNDEHIRVLLTA